MIDGTGRSLEFTLRLLPGMLVALGLLVITQRLKLSVVLLTAHLLANAAWSSLLVFYKDWSDPSWLERFLGVAAGAAAIHIMFYSLMAKRDSTWRSAYWIVIGSLVLSPILAVVYDVFPSLTLLKLYQVVLAPGYFFDSYSNPALAGLVWHGGIFLFIYLLLGRRWRKAELPAPAPDSSPALV